MSDIVIGQDDGGRGVTAAVGDRIRIELPENPTTGFRWQVETVDAAVLRLAATDFQPSASAAIGGGGLGVFHFDVIGSGSADLRLELKRSWETQSPRSTFSIRVSVP